MILFENCGSMFVFWREIDVLISFFSLKFRVENCKMTIDQYKAMEALLIKKIDEGVIQQPKDAIARQDFNVMNQDQPAYLIWMNADLSRFYKTAGARNIFHEKFDALGKNAAVYFASPLYKGKFNNSYFG